MDRKRQSDKPSPRRSVPGAGASLFLSRKRKRLKRQLIIKGYNLGALKALLPQYEGRVKCIYVGRVWQNGANKGGDKYRYYMVFKEKNLNIDGAVKFERFLEIVKGL